MSQQKNRAAVAGLLMLGMTLALFPSSYVAGEACPNETCLAGYQCGGQAGYFTPPGVMSICSPSMDGKACNWCDGVAVVRVCTPMLQPRKCIRPTKKTVCGNPKTGKCEKKTVVGIGAIYWCRDDGGAGTHKCDVTEECDGDKACTGS